MRRSLVDPTSRPVAGSCFLKVATHPFCQRQHARKTRATALHPWMSKVNAQASMCLNKKTQSPWSN